MFLGSFIKIVVKKKSLCVCIQPNSLWMRFSFLSWWTAHSDVLSLLGFLMVGKGFGGGKFKICLGKPGDHSVMVVKFLGTFSGLEDAGKLHKYYAENDHGRADLEKINYNNGKSNKAKEARSQPGKPEEIVLYGHIGIAEDLDKLDFDTKKRCLIQSKQEIQELADAPVKPE